MVNNDDDFLKSLLGGLKKLEPKPTPTRPAPSIYTRPDLENILRQAGWPEEHVPYMTEMALKESSGDPGATRVRRAGEGQKLPESSYGLWQINTLAHPQYDPQKLATDPVYNAKAALDVYKKQGFDAWLKSKRRLAAQGILPGQVKASAPAAPTTVSDDEFRAHLESLISPASPGVDDNFKQKIETLITGTATTPTNPAPGYAPVNTNTLDNSSIPSNRPTLQPRKNKVAAPIKAKPKAPIGEGTVTVDVGNLTPIDTSAGQFVDTGVQVDLPRQAGKATDSNGIAAKVTVNVQGVPTAEKLDYSIRKAYESVATKFDLTPDQIERGIQLHLERNKGLHESINDDTAEGTVEITLKDLENIKGKDVAQTDERMRQAQSRVGIEQIPPENLLTPEVINALKASTITTTEVLETPWVGMEDEQNVIVGALRSGGSAWRALAGLYRAADDLWHRPFGEGHRLINPSKFEDIKAYQGDDIYKYMSSIAATVEAPAEKLAKYGGTRAEIFQMAGAMPGDLSRIMLLSKLPGGMIIGMSADMAAQSAGRGEHFDKVASEAFKGAIFGSIAKYAGPVGKKWMAGLEEAGFSSAASKLVGSIAKYAGPVGEKWMAGLEEAGFSSAASKLGGGAATLAFTGAATYPVSRAFGADPKTALKETIFNTIFSLGDAVSVLAGRTVRAKDPAGNEVAFQIDPQGNAKEVQVPKGEVADVEILSPYNKQELAASNKIIEEMNRPMSELIREADLTVDGPDAIAANPQATAVLNHLLKNIAEEQGNAGSYRGFHGLPLYANYSGAFIKQLENMLDQAQLAKDASSMVEISNLIAKINDVTKRTAGEAGLYTKYEGLDDITQGTKAEERVHIRNERFGVTAQTPKLLEKPSVQKVFDIIKDRDPNRKDTYAMDEVIAQTFRPKAEEHLGLTPDEIKQTLKDVFRVLAENNENTLQYASSLKDVSPAATKFARRGHLLNLYARRKQQQPVAGGKPSEVSAAGSNTPGVRGRGAGPGIRHSSPDTRGTAERGSGTGPGGEGPIEPRFSQVTDRTELERRAARAIQELEELQAKGAPTREQIGEILGNPEHSYGRSPRGAIFDLKDALETGAELPLGDKRAWVDVPETAVKAGAEARNQEIFEEVTAAPAAPKKTGKYVPNPNAVERGSVLEDGKIWVQGQQVFPTDESVAVVRAMAEHNNALITEKLKELDQLKRSGQVTREQLDSVIGEDHRFGTDVDAAIRDYESVLLDNGMYLQDIAEANTAYNTHQVAKQVKTKAPKESTPKAKEPSTPVAKEDPWSVQSREAHLKNVQAINKKLGIKEWQPPAKPDPNIEAWKQRQRLAELSDTRPAADKTVDEIVDRDVRQAYKDAGGDQFKAVEGVLKRYEQDAINMQSSGSALFQKKIEALRNKYGPILEFNKRRASGGSIDPQFAQLKHGSRHLFKPEVLVEGPGKMGSGVLKSKLKLLEGLKAEDFSVEYPNLTHNHVIFKGEDIDVRRIQFAQALKDKRVFDKKAVDEVSAFTDENFPQLAAFWKPRKSTGTPLATNPNPVAAERMAKARGMDVETSPQKIADRIVNIYREFKRQFKEIDPNESVQMARTADSFRLLSSLNSWAKTQATNDVARITKPLSREQYDVFENVLILRDKKKAVEQGMKPGHGYIDLADVEKSLKEYEDAAKADPAISKALADREALRRKTVGDLVKIDLLGKRALDNDSYFHRQVPQGGENNLFLSMGNRDLRVRKKGFEKKRTGEGDDYNTNYVEAEVEWLSQAHAQIRKRELLQEIKRAVDISDDLKLQAKIQGVDWHTLVDKSTHRIWQPQEGSYFYKVMSAPDELLTDIFSGKHTLSTAEAELREALARGQKKPEWVLPSGVAKLMDNFEVQPHENAIKQTTASAMASWKQWALINPKNYLSYNIRNFISDLDAAMAYPGIIKELPAAIKDIYKYSRDKNHAAAAEIEQAIKDGVMDSGQTFAEIPDISKLGVFKIFADSDTNVLSRGLNKVWDAMKNSSNARENWIRLAAYRHIKQRLANGDVIYGASNRGQVDALAGNPGRQAAKIARELVGDYGGISEAGRAIRKHMMPFYSWCVPTTTEILTRDGWKAHDELALGEEVLTYNIETRTTEWQPVQDKAVLDYDGPLVTLNNSFGHKYQFTPDHRCVVIEQYKDKRKVVLAKDLKSHHKLPVVAPHEFSTGSVLNETEAALLGFLVTDGYFRTRKESPNSFEAVLYQKKPGEVQWIRDTFKDYISSESVHPQTGVICFRLSAPKISKIRSVFQTKEDLPSVITRLGQAECRAMYDAMMRAEGSSANGATQFPQNRGPVLDGFQILCYMLGKAGHIRDKRGGTGHAALYVKGRDKISVHKWQRTEEQYTGQVWCPKTANSTWIMRQDGKVMITGNCEINAPRYVRMIANIPNEAGGKSRLAGMAGTKVAGKVALVGTKRAAQLMAITAAINAWNHLVFPDLEDQLMKTDVGKRPHLIVGTNPDGTARVFQADTALRDAMDWFDAGDIVSDISEVRDGRATVIDKIAEGVKAPVNRVVQALGPIKTAGEFVFGESTYPDIFEKKTSFALKSRPIRDRAEYLAQAFAMKGIYQRVMGRPTPPASGPIGQLSDWFLTMRVDPEESIFWNIRGRVSDYKKKMGKSTGGTDPTEKSNTLFYYKQAIRWGNQEAAERYLRQYKEEFGGTDKGLQQSLDRTHPLGQLAKSDWPEFIKQLTPDERDQLKVAIGYYDEKFKSGPGATPAKDTTVEELLQMTFPGKDQEGIDRMVEAERRKEQADAQREANKKARGLR